MQGRCYVCTIGCVQCLSVDCYRTAKAGPSLAGQGLMVILELLWVHAICCLVFDC